MKTIPKEFGSKRLFDEKLFHYIHSDEEEKLFSLSQDEKNSRVCFKLLKNFIHEKLFLRFLLTSLI